MGTNLPKIKPAKTGGLGNYPKVSGTGFKVGNIAYFERAPDTRWIQADGSSYTSAQYPELSKVLNVPVPMLNTPLTISAATAPTASGTAVNSAISNDGLYYAVSNMASVPSVLIYKLVNEVYTYLTSIASGIASGQTINSIAWSPDNTYIAFTTSGTPVLQLAKNVNDVFTKLANPNWTSAQYAVSLAWLDVDYLVVSVIGSGTLTPLVATYTLANDVATIVASSPSPTPSVPFYRMKVTPGKLLVVQNSGAGAGFSVYQRVGNILTLVTTYASTGVSVGSYNYAFEVVGEADYVIIQDPSAAVPYVYIFAKDKTGAYSKKTTLIGSVNIAYDIIVDPNRLYMYMLGPSLATTRIYLFNNGNPIPFATNVDTPNITATWYGGQMSKDGKYVAYQTSTTPYIAGMKATTPVLDRFYTPACPDRYKLGRRLYPFIKAKP